MIKERENIKKYLDQCIEYWRARKNEPEHPYSSFAHFYVDAYQSMRVSIFGEEIEDGE